MTDAMDELHLGHDPEKVKKDGMIACRSFGAFIYAKPNCAGCPANKSENNGGEGAANGAPLSLLCFTSSSP